MQGYNELTQTLQWVQSFVVINSKCLGETSCRKFGLITFNFIINPMFDFEHPFARNKLPTLGEWHQGPSVVDNKKVIFFLHDNFPLLCIFTFQCLFHSLRFFRKSDIGPFHLFGGNPPITRPLFILSLGPFSSSILLWFIQTLILRWNKFFFRRKV